MVRFLRRFGRLVVRAIERSCHALAAPVPGVSQLMAVSALAPRLCEQAVDAGALGQPAVAMMFWWVPGDRTVDDCDKRGLAASPGG